MPLRILIADDERAARYGLARALARDGHHLVEAADLAATREALRGEMPDLVFLDLRMPDGDGRTILRDFPNDLPCEIVVLTAQDDVATAVECIRLGAADYVTKPYEVEHVRAIARRCAQRLALQREVEALRERVDQGQASGALVGASRPMRELGSRIARIAAAATDVLIRGETGTGKELVARELHRLSGRPGPFVAVNMAAVTESLAESALFGHVRGAFTGADRDHAGAFEQARAGTLFLDEIGDMPLAAQAKILRALQERAVQPVGSGKLVAVDVRVISATHQDLERLIVEGRFRQDLYYRIRGVELQVPPLRVRREDIILLANVFLDRLASQLPEPPRLCSEAVTRILTYSWPGNVRELEHVIRAAALLADGAEIGGAALGLPAEPGPAKPSSFDAYLELSLTEAKRQLVEDFERVMIGAALARHGGNVSAAASDLGIHRQSLQQKMTQLGVSRS